MSGLFARVGGSNVASNCPYADQGGRHAGMVVGVDHRGRSRVAVWRNAAPEPLTTYAISRLRLTHLLDQPSAALISPPPP
jgi:hypothetical protein